MGQPTAARSHSQPHPHHNQRDTFLRKPTDLSISLADYYVLNHGLHTGPVYLLLMAHLLCPRVCPNGPGHSNQPCLHAPHLPQMCCPAKHPVCGPGFQPSHSGLCFSPPSALACTTVGIQLHCQAVQPTRDDTTCSCPRPAKPRGPAPPRQSNQPFHTYSTLCRLKRTRGLPTAQPPRSPHLAAI